MSVHRDGAERVGVVVIHGVGGARPGWINNDVIRHLETCDPGLEFEDHSEVHELTAMPAGAAGTPPAGRTEDAAFSSYLRRAGYGHGKNVVFMELFWADLSRVGRGWIAGFFATLQVFYEAPLVLAHAFMREQTTARRPSLRLLLAQLIRAANWLLRWPISGLNTSVFCGAIALWLVEVLRYRFPDAAPLFLPDVFIVGAALLLTAFIALRLTDWRDEKNILKCELAPSTAIFAVLLLLALAVAYQHSGPQGLAGLPAYLRLAATPILLLWLLWSHIVVAGVVLLSAVWLRWLVSSTGLRHGTPMRPAAALGLTMVQGVIWKIVIALIWWGLIGQLVPGSIRVAECPFGAQAACRDLGQLVTELVVIVTLNLVMAGVLAVCVLAIFAVRGLLVRRRLDAVRNGDIRLPRVIVSRVAVFVLCVLTLLNFGIFYGHRYVTTVLQFMSFDTGPAYDSVAVARAFLAEHDLAISTARIVILCILLFVILTSALSGVLHIVRDLVNHQYSRKKAGTPRWQLSVGGQQLAFAAQSEDEEYPRRQRIIERLDTMMREIVSHEECQRLILIGHSQGTVILYDYLRSKWDDETLKSIKHIDILTLGSPLGHIYQQYFPDYERPVTDAAELNAKLRSWTNLWRADDPIGHRVDLVRGKFINNIALPAGGHRDYWRDEHVCRIILALIDTRGAPVVAPPGADASPQTTGAP